MQSKCLRKNVKHEDFTQKKICSSEMQKKKLFWGAPKQELITTRPAL
jgi:hypothetical protein